MGHGSLPLVALALLVVSTLVASGEPTPIAELKDRTRYSLLPIRNQTHDCNVECEAMQPDRKGATSRLWNKMVICAGSIHVQVGKPRERKWTAKNTAAESPLRIFAAASHMTKEGCHYLLRTAAHYQIDLQIIGMNDERLTQKLQKASRTSIKLLAAYELARVLPEDSLIMLVDAFDVVFQRGIADILEAYDSLGSPDILFSAEANCWPPVLATFGYCDLAPDVAGSKYLNSGEPCAGKDIRVCPYVHACMHALCKTFPEATSPIIYPSDAFLSLCRGRHWQGWPARTPVEGADCGGGVQLENVQQPGHLLG